MSSTRRFQIQRYQPSGLSGIEDHIAVEEPLEIWLTHYVDGSSKTIPLTTTMRTPGNDEELILGWLFTTAQITPAQIHSIVLSGSQRLRGLSGNRYIVTLYPNVEFSADNISRGIISQSSCGVCGQHSIESLSENLQPIAETHRVTYSTEVLLSLANALRKRQAIFTQTGGCHSIGLLDGAGDIIDVQEDVGRHNALDKLIGANLAKLPGQYALLLSGRVSFEMVQKALRAGVGTIIAFGAPTSLAIDLCIEWDVTLLGFLSNSRFNIYHHHTSLTEKDNGLNQ